MGRPAPDEVANEAVIAVDHPCLGGNRAGDPSNEFIGIGS